MFAQHGQGPLERGYSGAVTRIEQPAHLFFRYAKALGQFHLSNTYLLHS